MPATTDDMLHERHLRKVSRILVSQPPPTSNNSPYQQLSKHQGIEIDFYPFIRIEPISEQEFHNQKITINQHTAIIFTSRHAIDHFFMLAKRCRQDVSADMKYFCITEQTSNYLQKYIVIRKRRIFYGNRQASDLLPLLKRYKKENYLFPCSDARRDDIPDFLRNQNIHFRELTIYHTLSNDLSKLPRPLADYDLIAFFSPSGVRALRTNYPNFEQKNLRIAAFGPTTAQAVREEGFILDIEAPRPETPSMTAAIASYIQQTQLTTP